MEGTIRRRDVAFFESSSFRAFNFALLQKLTAVEQSVQGYSDLIKTNPSPATLRKLQKSIAELSEVVQALQKLLDLARAYKTAEINVAHPEVILKDLHSNFHWPKSSSSTYSKLLVTIVEDAISLVIAQIFQLEKASLKGLKVAFRRRENNVVMSLNTPYFSWVNSSVNTLLKQKDVCNLQLSDSLNTIVMRAGLCVLKKNSVELFITPLHSNSLYIHLPAARQLQAFALDDPKE